MNLKSGHDSRCRLGLQIFLLTGADLHSLQSFNKQQRCTRYDRWLSVRI